MNPSPQQLWQAIETYLAIAYEGSQAPATVRARLDALRTAADPLEETGVFERDPASPGRCKFRLGNRFYPHMKLVIDRSPGGTHWFFRADTHDQHIRPDPRSLEHAAFVQLMEMNQSIAQRIEAAWERERLPTFKSFLREDLARRQAQ